MSTGPSRTSTSPAGDPRTAIGSAFQQAIVATLGDDYAGSDPLIRNTANPELGEIQSQLEAKHKIFKLRDALVKLSGYDAIYIDTPPAFNFYTLSALIAADSCLIPFDCDEFSRQALYNLIENVEETRQDHNEELEVEGIVVNQFQPRASLPTRIVDELREEGLPILDTYISSSVKMRESHDAGVPLVHLAPKHKLTSEFMALFELLHPGFAVTTPQDSDKATV
mgnify:CR=1 FL=1